MREGVVLVLDEREMINREGDSMAFYTRSDVYRADLVICGDKIVKNRWGKHGMIMESEFESEDDRELRIRLLLDIWDKIIQREKEIKEVK